MWIAKIRIKHDCIIGNRCAKYKIMASGMPFNVYREKGVTYAPQVHTLQGNPKAIDDFIEELRADNRVGHLSVEGNIVFFIEKRKDTIPSTFYHPQLLPVRPVLVDDYGYEYWEVASWKRFIITDFIRNVKRTIEEVKIVKLRKTKLTHVYSFRLAPQLTPSQRTAVELALREGFYTWPKRTSLGRLAKAMGVSVPTFREHLKKAEEKLMPDSLRFVE